MSTRRLKNLAEQATKLQEEIEALEKMVQLKDKINQINDNTVAQQRLFPSSLEIWRKIVAAQIQLYKLREKEKKLRKELEKDRIRNIDFSVLNKYRRFKNPNGKEEKVEAQTESVNSEETIRKKVAKDPLGFMVRFRLSNAYEAIQRQEQILTRPKLAPFIEKKTKSGPAYFYFDREKKKWKRFFPGSDEQEHRMKQKKHKGEEKTQPRVIDGSRLPFFMQQHINRMNEQSTKKKRLPSISFSMTSGTSGQRRHRPSVGTIQEDEETSSGGRSMMSSAMTRFPSASAPSLAVSSQPEQFIGPRSGMSSGVTRSRSSSLHHVIEETEEVLADINAPGNKLQMLLPDPDSADIIVQHDDRKATAVVDADPSQETKKLGKLRPTSKQDRKKVEKLKMVASQMHALQEELLNGDEYEEQAEALDEDEEVFKSCRYLYRMAHCPCVGKHSDMINDDVRKQVAGTIDVLDHTDEGECVGAVDCMYCMATPRHHVTNWLTSLHTGSTRGVYGDPYHNWFPKKQQQPQQK